MTQSVVHREAVRILLLDERDRVLLLRGCDPAIPDEMFWFTPGGGLEEHERSIDAAARELYEETGIEVFPEAFTGPLSHEVLDFSFDGTMYRQYQEYFGLCTGSDTRVRPARLDEIEERTFAGHQWWTWQELRDSAEDFRPGVDRLWEVLVRYRGDVPASRPSGQVAAGVSGDGR